MEVWPVEQRLTDGHLHLIRVDCQGRVARRERWYMILHMILTDLPTWRICTPAVSKALPHPLSLAAAPHRHGAVGVHGQRHLQLEARVGAGWCLGPAWSAWVRCEPWGGETRWRLNLAVEHDVQASRGPGTGCVHQHPQTSSPGHALPQQPGSHREPVASCGGVALAAVNTLITAASSPGCPTRSSGNSSITRL